jgi:hypothetical protein
VRGASAGFVDEENSVCFHNYVSKLADEMSPL